MDENSTQFTVTIVKLIFRVQKTKENTFLVEDGSIATEKTQDEKKQSIFWDFESFRETKIIEKKDIEWLLTPWKSPFNEYEWTVETNKISPVLNSWKFLLYLSVVSEGKRKLRNLKLVVLQIVNRWFHRRLPVCWKSVFRFWIRS